MPVRIIPDVYAEVRTGAIATSLPFGLNTLAIVGTAERGTMDTPTLIASKQAMYDAFGEPGDYRTTAVSEGSELTLVRAGALAFDGGAPNVYFVRIGSTNVAAATRYITADDGTGSAGGYCAALEAISEGSWGNDLKYKVETADGDTTTDGHVAAVGATVENVFDDAAADPGSYLFDTYDGTTEPDTTVGTIFSYLGVPSADTFVGVASPSTSVELQRSSADNYQRTTYNIIHTQAGYLKGSGEVDPTETLTTTSSEMMVQSFLTIDGFIMSGAVLRLKQGTATGNLTLSLYLADDNHRPTGSALATSSTMDASTVGSSYGYEEFVFTSSYTVEPQTQYCLVLEDTLSAGTVTWGAGSATTNEYTDGKGQYYNGSAWSDLTGAYDLLFHPVYDIPETSCVSIINDWDTGFMGTQTKKIIWECANPSTTSQTPDAANDTLYLTYETAESMKFTLSYGDAKEVYYVVDGYDLINDINDTDTGSSYATADEPAYGGGNDYPDRYPLQTTGWQYFGVGAGESTGTATSGNDGADASASDYADGLDLLLNVDAHIILCAGQYSPTVHAYLQSHVDNASNDENKRERVGVCGHRYGLTLSQIQSSNVSLSSKRMMFVSPGIVTTNHDTGAEETVSAAYAAALLAGFMGSQNPSISPLNKGVSVGDLETEYTNPELEQLIKKKINPIRVSRLGGFRWAYSCTSSANTSWHEITTVRIADYASIGIRSASEGFIGEKNLTIKRTALKTAVVGFMETMRKDQMLSDDGPYTVQVSATRQEEVQGIVRVEVSLKPVFAIKYIMVTEYVE